jgi:hypothetical protein
LVVRFYGNGPPDDSVLFCWRWSLTLLLMKVHSERRVPMAVSRSISYPREGRVTIVVVAFKRSKTPKSSEGGVPQDGPKAEIHGYHF